MHGTLLALATTLLFPYVALSQGAHLNQNGLANQAPQVEVPAQPLGTVTLGYAYNWNDQGGYHRSTNGWLAKPALNLTRQWAIYLDASNYYGANLKGRMNAHTYTLGVSRTLKVRSRFKPSLFTQSGDSRTSNAGTIVHGFALLAGVNVTTPINNHVSFSINPIEYVYVYAIGQMHNSYSPKFSLAFPFGKRAVQ